MKEHFESAINYLKSTGIEGCITGSYFLEFFNDPKQDLDLFVYNEKALTKTLYTLMGNPMFQLIDPLEKWKCTEYLDKGQSSFRKIGIISVKFKYNLLLDINVVLKKEATNIFGVLSTFDFDLVARGWDIPTGQFFSLSDNNTRIMNWNTWNLSYTKFDIWKVSRLLRQIERCFKYHNRGYNTDRVIERYIYMINQFLEYENIFNSETFEMRLDEYKTNIRNVKKLCELWLKDHNITEEQMNTIKELTKKDI